MCLLGIFNLSKKPRELKVSFESNVIYISQKKNEMASIFRSAKIGEGLIRKSAPRVSDTKLFHGLTMYAVKLI